MIDTVKRIGYVRATVEKRQSLRAVILEQEKLIRAGVVLVLNTGFVTHHFINVIGICAIAA
jgi:hypothetical protein